MRLALVVVLLLAPLRLFAQSCTSPLIGSCSVTTSASLNITPVFSLTVIPSSTAANQPTESDYVAGFGDSEGPQVVLSANASWVLHVSASMPVWDAVQTLPGVTPRGDKPASDLEWSTDGSYIPLSTTLVQMSGGGPVADGVTQLNYRIRYSIAADTPGNYSMGVVFTITAP